MQFDGWIHIFMHTLFIYVFLMHAGRREGPGANGVYWK